MAAAQEAEKMQRAGFSQEEIADWMEGERSRMASAGFSQKEIDDWSAPRGPDTAKANTSLAKSTVSALKTMGQTVADVATVYAPLEAAFNLSTGMVLGFPAYLGGGVGTLVGRELGLTDEDPKAVASRMSELMTYQPHTAAGQRLTAAAMYPLTELTKASEGAGQKVADVTGSAPLAALTEATIQMLPPALIGSMGRRVAGKAPTDDTMRSGARVLAGDDAPARTDEALTKKLGEVYENTGVDPQAVIDAAREDPTVIQDLAAENRPVPKALGVTAEEVKAPEPKAAVAERPEESPEPTKQQKAVLDRISIGDEDKAHAYTLDTFYTQMKDELYPIRQLTEHLKGDETLSASKDPYKLARELGGLSGKAQQFLDHSPFKFDTYEDVGKSFTQVLEPVKNDLDGFRAYAVARRSIELQSRGIETGVPLDEAKAVVSKGGKYAQPFRDLVEYQDHLVNYLVDAGVLDKEKAVAMREANRDYVPFFRLMDEAQGAGGPGKGMSVRSPIKGIKGSTRQVIDPLESIVKNTYLYTTLAERNAVGRALVDLAEKTDTDLVKKVAAPGKAIEVGEKEVKAFMQEHGIEGDAEAFSIFRRGYLNPADDQIVVFRDGKREVYEVPKDVAGAFKATDRETANILWRILSIPARTLRAGATLAPDFMLRNFGRDQLSAAVFSDHGYIPVIDFMRGMFSLAKKDRDFQSWLKSGGANATLVSMDRRYLQAELNKIADHQTVMERAWNAVTLPVEMLRIASELIENATRLGEFKRGIAGDYSKAAIQEAGYGAREVTLDFARMGAKTRALNMITAFWNAQIEGIDRAVRAFKDNPMRTSAKVAAYITLPSVLLWWANHDDPRWKEIPDWERDLFWIVMTKDHIYRIPKPFELGVLFGSLPERLLDKFAADKPDAFHAFGKTLQNTFGVNIFPTASIPILEQLTNHSFFTDRPLIPSAMEGILPEYQYSPYTSETTKALGKIIGNVPGLRRESVASPIVIDNYIRGWTGTLGQYAVNIADLALRKAGLLPDPVTPAATLADIPVIKAFVVRHPSAQAQSIQNFNEQYRDAKQVVDTIQFLAHQGDVASALKVARMDPADMVKLDGIHSALANGQRVVQLVYKNPNIPPDEKRQLIDNVYGQMIDMARAGEQTITAMRKSLKVAAAAEPVRQ